MKRRVPGNSAVTLLLAAVLAAPVVILAEPAPTPQHRSERGMPGMPMQDGGMMGGTGTGGERGGQMSGMMCTCPSALHRAGGALLAVLGAILAVSATAALIALTLFLVRRSKRIPET